MAQIKMLHLSKDLNALIVKPLIKSRQLKAGAVDAGAGDGTLKKALGPVHHIKMELFQKFVHHYRIFCRHALSPLKYLIKYIFMFCANMFILYIILSQAAISKISQAFKIFEISSCFMKNDVVLYLCYVTLYKEVQRNGKM